ncbi:MAG TPA: glycosyltransferase, partial [Terriglobales bacterium]|nr:glycosyltransferase [Terriglobales bacterium]
PEKSSGWFKSAGSKLGALRKLYAYFRLHRPDVVHAFLPAASIMGILPAHFARVPVFIGSRRSLAADYRRGRVLGSIADSLSLKFSHTNLGNSLAVTESMISGGSPRARSQTIHNGVDTMRFHPGALQAWRATMGWDDSNIVFGMVANFHPYKRHIDFVDAAALILRNYPQARFLIVGANYGTQKTVLDKVNELGLDSQIRYFANAPDPEEIFAGIDVLVSASETEGFSNVLLEAMAAGKPVIATKVGGNAEIVVPGETGFLVPAYSPEAIAGACEELIKNPRLRCELGSKGRKIVVKQFSLETMVRSHEQLYLRLAAESSHKSS